ncbi:hypothetical protein EJ02DRAFT_254710 [Clathrospora elynae]|uniref:Uncharacterized protein n=1 Tax=Clathrospora elynae TaxID=706981 RepID=A0A6A5SHG3_9PLEO|nr:hypothetical protein EJ02DRAFT_254710 [Clathrospora elynae]
MQKVWDLKSKFNGLTISASSVPSTSTLSSTSVPKECRHHGREHIAPKYPIGKPTRRLLPDEPQISLPTVKLVTQHSNSFNSERATGMNKLQQLQFVQQMKGCIVGMLLIVLSEGGHEVM